MEIPVFSAATWLCAQLWGTSAATMEIVRTTTLFAAVPAVLTAGGLGRLAAHRSVELPRRAAILHTCAVHAVAGTLLLLIALLPQELFPGSVWTWAAAVTLGALAGAGCGLAIGVVCAGETPRQVSDVLSLVRLPAATLRQLIDSEDLSRLGAAVRHRATTMFDGLLEPAAPRPEEGAPRDDASDEVGAPKAEPRPPA